MPTKIKSLESRIKLQADQPQTVRSGGENQPLEYPHLYRIEAGGWRISYAVEHNRLAILVLEVLSPEGIAPAETPREETEREQINKKVKIKLLDLPEELAGEESEPELAGPKLKIKLLDLSEDLNGEETATAQPGSGTKIRLVK